MISSMTSVSLPVGNTSSRVTILDIWPSSSNAASLMTTQTLSILYYLSDY